MEVGAVHVTLGADTQQFERKMADAERSFKGFANRMSGAAPLAQQRAREVAIAAVEAMDQQYKVATGRIKEGLARGFITPAEAKVAGREAALAYNQGVIGAIDQASLTKGAFAGKEGTRVLADLTGSLRSVDAAAARTTTSTGRLGQSVASATTSILRMNPAAGQLSYVLGSMAMGAPLMIGVLGGMAALSAAWKRATRDAKDIRDAADDAAAAVRRLARERDSEGTASLVDHVTALATAYDAMGEKVRAAEQELARAQRGGGRGDANAARITQAAERLNRVRQEQAQLLRDQRTAEQLLSEAQERNADRRRREQEAEAERTRRAADQARSARTVSMIGMGGDTSPRMIEAVRSQMAALNAEITKLDDERRFEQQGGRFDELTAAIERARRKLDELREMFRSIPNAAFLRDIQLAPVQGFDPGLPGRTRRDAEAVLRQPATPLSGGGDPMSVRLAEGFQRATAMVDSYVRAGISLTAVEGEKRVQLEAAVETVRRHNQAVDAIASRLNNVSFGQGQMNILGGALEGALTALSPASLVSSLVGMGVGKVQEAIFGGLGRLFGGRKSPVRALERLSDAADKVAASMMNVPLAFNAALVRTQVGHGKAAAGGVTINGGLTIQANDWGTFRRSMQRAAASGDDLARSLIRSGA